MKTYRVVIVGPAHHYFMLYRIVGEEAVIEYVAHFRRSARKMMTETK